MAVAGKVGPWGASGGKKADISVGSTPVSLKSITVFSSDSESPLNVRIIGISFVYVDENKDSIRVGPWGSTDGSTAEQCITTTIEMGPGEYIVELSGTFDDSGVTSLTLVTDQALYGPFGGVAGSPFSVPLVNGMVVAFFGCSDDTQLKALGIYVAPVNGWPVMIGPWGGCGGTPIPPYTWSPSDHLKSITVYSSNNIELNDGHIYGFSFSYVDQNECPIDVGPWGIRKGTKDHISIDAGEYLKSVSGTFDDYGLTSLKFTTNHKEHPLLGREKGTAFGVELPDDGDDHGMVVGFFGSHHSGDSCLTKIGFILTRKKIGNVLAKMAKEAGREILITIVGEVAKRTGRAIDDVIRFAGKP